MKFKKKLILLLLLLLLIPSIISLAFPGFPQTDDGNWMIIRFSAFYQALREGQLPVRFLGRLNFGYGYPVANFLYPGFMYLALPLKAIGFGFINSIKIVLAASMLLSGVFTFLWLRKIFDETSSFFASLFYVYTPYHLYDLTRRGSVGEILSLATLPFILWQLEKANVVLVSLGIGFLILAHNTLALLFLGLIFIYMFFTLFTSNKKEELLKKYLMSILLGLGISAFFWLPAATELKYTVFGKTSVSDPSQYFANSNLIGISTIAILIASILIFLIKRAHFRKHRLTLMFILLALLTIFLASSQSTILWSVFPSNFIQFPFRMLSILIIASTFLTAFLISITKYKIQLGIAIILVTLYSSLTLVMPSKFIDQKDSFYSTNEATTTVQDEYMPLWVKKKPNSHFSQKIELISGIGKISNIKYSSKNISFDFLGDKNLNLRINTIYYPGWEAKINGRKVPVSYKNEGGLIEISSIEAENKVELTFTETPLRKAADILSLFSFGVIIFLSLKNKLHHT